MNQGSGLGFRALELKVLGVDRVWLFGMMAKGLRIRVSGLRFRV